jgi:sugar O-acyltransferase (sialic acid O-acetyltransferase NeuD family)
MTRGRLLILGAGGHGKVAADCAASEGRWSDIGFYDDRWPSLSSCGPWPVLGASDDLLRMEKTAAAFVAIGDAEMRLAWIARLRTAGFQLATLVHARAVVSAEASIGLAAIVVAGAIVNIGARLEEGVIINTGATVDHDCEIGAGAHICPGAHLAGSVTVGRAAWIGIGASVRQGVAIGAGAIIGAGAAVVGPIGEGVTAVGVPARPMARREKDKGGKC